MADNEKDYLAESAEEYPPLETDDPTDNTGEFSPYFQPVDVSEPRAVRKEIDIIEEALAERRRDWIKTHMIYLYAVIGVVIVGISFLFIQLYNGNTNPISRFISATSKNFGTSFRYDVTLSENGESVMHYDGTASIHRSQHSLEAVYDAEYTDYSYRAVVKADNSSSVKGVYYKNKWTAHDCTEKVLDFFDFDTDFRAGNFDSVLSSASRA